MNDSLKIDPRLTAQAAALLEACRGRGVLIATAESCTGGLVVATLTALPGSSDVVECGFVTYSNAAKEAMLGVPAATLKRHGAVSGERRVCGMTLPGNGAALSGS